MSFAKILLSAAAILMGFAAFADDAPTVSLSNDYIYWQGKVDFDLKNMDQSALTAQFKVDNIDSARVSELAGAVDGLTAVKNSTKAIYDADKDLINLEATVTKAESQSKAIATAISPHATDAEKKNLKIEGFLDTQAADALCTKYNINKDPDWNTKDKIYNNYTATIKKLTGARDKLKKTSNDLYVAEKAVFDAKNGVVKAEDDSKDVIKKTDEQKSDFKPSKSQMQAYQAYVFADKAVTDMTNLLGKAMADYDAANKGANGTRTTQKDKNATLQLRCQKVIAAYNSASAILGSVGPDAAQQKQGQH